MAGTFQFQNKVRPGAYINFKAEHKPALKPGTRGIVTLPMVLPWGPTNQMITVTADDVVRGLAFNKVGLRNTDDAILPLMAALENAPTALVFRMGTGAVAATAQVTTGVTATAAYPGTLGNNITISVVANGDAFDVITTVRGLELDRQTLTYVAEYVPNGWVVFTADDGTKFAAVAGVTLATGTDGTVEPETDYQSFMNAARPLTWQCMAVPTDEESIPPLIAKYINQMRESDGKKVQAVVQNYPTADYEGIISVSQGYKIGDTEYPVEVFVCWFAGATAGAALDESNTYKVITGATEIIGPMTNSEIETALLNGQLVISKRQDGAIVIEKDINTLHTFTEDRTYPFSKNRVIRCLDDIATQIGLVFETSYIGKVDNNDSGRTMFKGDVIGYINTLQEMGAIQNFDATTDIEVLPGEDIDAVVCNLWIQPVDAMEKLYMTVVVS